MSVFWVWFFLSFLCVKHGESLCEREKELPFSSGWRRALGVCKFRRVDPMLLLSIQLINQQY